MSVQRQRLDHSSPVPEGLVLPRLPTQVNSQTGRLAYICFELHNYGLPSLRVLQDLHICHLIELRTQTEDMHHEVNRAIT